MEDTKNKHQIILKNREQALISGAPAVDSFDERRVVLITSLGVLVIKGEGLHIRSLSVESGDVSITGKIEALEYVENEPSGGGSFWGKLFK